MILISPIVRICLKVLSMILFAVTLFATFGGKINPEYMTMPSVLVLALPYLAIATFVVGVIWLIKGSFLMPAAAAVTIIVGWGTLKDVTPVAFSKEPYNPERTFRIMSFNCLHLADTTKSSLPGNRAINFLIDSDADIICLQELMDFENSREIHNWSRGLIDSLYAAYPYRAGTSGNDLKVLSKFPVRMLEVKSKNEEDENFWRPRRRWRMFEVNIDGFQLPILNFHLTPYDLTDTEREVLTEIRGVRTAKNSYRELRKDIFPKLGEAFRARAKTVDEMTTTTTGISTMIACGDFNDVPGGWAYNIMRKAGFKDAYVETSFGPTNTFNQFLFLFHIDQIFYRGYRLRALKTKRHSINTSDHYPIEATFEILN